MPVISIALASIGITWSIYILYRSGEKKLLLAALLPASFLVFDIGGIEAIRAFRIGLQLLWIGIHVLMLGAIFVIGHSVREHQEAQRKHKRELAQARYESEAMRRLKTEFLANMNHEIRTPLTTIIGFSSLLMDEVDEEQGRLMKIIERSGNRLLETLDSILDLAMLEAGTVELTRETLDVVDEARIHAARHQPVAQAKGVQIEVETDRDRIDAYVDRACLSRIFSRLIGNAIKFTDDGKVTVSLLQTDGECRIVVRDTGIGIDEDFIPRLFDEFSQESTGHRRAYEGTGLGLSVTKRLVELLGGDIDVVSERDAGSTFIVTIPTKLNDNGLNNNGRSPE